jgi:Cytochrome oxidase complex assembly protein 1
VLEYGPVRRLRPWIPLVLGAVVLLSAAGVAGLTAIEDASKGPAYELATTCLPINRQMQRLLGVVTGFGFTVQGSVVENADGTGHANIDFHVNGSWRGGHIQLHAVERRRQWRLLEPGILKVAGRTYRIRPKLVWVLHPARYSGLCAPPTSSTTFPRL